MKRKIRAVLIDLGGVLITNDIATVSEKFSSKLKREDISEIFNFIHSKKRALIEIKNFLKEKNVKEKDWLDFLKDFYETESRNNDLLSIIKKIKKINKYIFVITTNNSPKTDLILKKYNLQDIPDLVVNSSHIKVLKSSPEFWKKTFKEILKFQNKIKVGELLVIDDSEKNIKAAEKFGAQTIKYFPNIKIDKKIEKILN